MKTPSVLVVVGILGVYLPIFTYHSMVKYGIYAGKYTIHGCYGSYRHRLNAEVSEHLEKASSEPSMKHLKMRREMQEMREFLVPWRGDF